MLSPQGGFQGLGRAYGSQGSRAEAALWPGPPFAPGARCETATRNMPDGLFFNPSAFARPIVMAGGAIPSSGGVAFAMKQVRPTQTADQYNELG
jgi:hypothetical protein